MPPKMYPIIAPPSPVIPTEINDDHDVLCVMDMLDTLDSIPGELTQRFGDLRELDAVLNATTVHLTSRLEALTRILQQASSASSSASSSTFNTNTSALVSSIAKSPVQSSSTTAVPPVTTSKTDDPEEPPSLGNGTSVPDAPATTTMSTITINSTLAGPAILAADGTAVTNPISTSVPTSNPNPTLNPDGNGGQGSKMKIDTDEHAKGKEMASITEMNVDADGGSGSGPGPGTAAETRTTGDTDEGGPAEQPESTTIDQSGDKQERTVVVEEVGPATTAAPTSAAAAATAMAVEDMVEPPAAGDTGNTGAGGDTAESGIASAIPKDSDTIPAQDPATVSKAVTMDVEPAPITSPDQDAFLAPVPPVGTHSTQDPGNVSKSTATAGESALALDQPWDRFQILLEIAEELSRFKVGVEDKVKVAGSACDHVVQHQSHIASLLSSSTLLLPAYPTSHLNNQQSYLPQQTLDRGMTNGGTSSSGVGGKRHRNSPMPSRYANLVSSTNGNPNGGSLSGGLQNPNASSGNHVNGNGSGSGGYGQSYAPAPGSETPSKKRRKTGAGAGGQGGGGKEKKGSGTAAGGPGWWDEEESAGGKGGKRWDGRSQTQNPFNADPRGSSNPFTSPYPDYASHLQQNTTISNTTITGAGGKQRNSPSVAGSVRGGSVMPSIAGDPNSKTGNTGGGGGKKKSGAGAGGTKKQGQGAGAGGEGKSAQGSTSTASTAGGGGGGGRKKGQGKSGLATGGAGGAGTADEYGYYNPGGSNSAGMGPNGGVGGQTGSRTGAGPGTGGVHHNPNRGPHGLDPNSNLDHDMDHDADADADPEGDADADADTRLYCYCQKQSYGEMIGCDDDGCQFEWFHLSCLLLDRPPEGTWLCPDCAVRAESKKKRGGGGKGGGGGRKGK